VLLQRVSPSQMLPAIRERLDFLAVEFEKLAADNDHLRGELAKHSGNPIPSKSAAHILAGLRASGREHCGTQSIVSSHGPAAALSPQAWDTSSDPTSIDNLHPAPRRKISGEGNLHVPHQAVKHDDDVVPFSGSQSDSEAEDITSSRSTAQVASLRAAKANFQAKKNQDTKIQHAISGRTMGESEVASRVAAGDDEDSVSQLIFLDVIPAIVISINALVVGLSADICPEHTVWVGLEIFFTSFFTLEVLVKMKVFTVRGYLLGPDWYWSWFDCFCVALAYLEMCMSLPSSGFGSLSCSGNEEGSAGFGALKMLKLARLGRIVRLLKFKIFIELKLMIQGVFTGLRVLLWAIVLLWGCIYLLGVVCKTFFSDHEEFSTVPASMFTIFRCFTDGCAAYDGVPLQERIRLRLTTFSGIWMVAYILVFLFITIGIFNLIMAVFIDNVNDGSVKKKQYNLGITAEKTELTLAERLQGMCVKSGVIPEPQEDDSDDDAPMVARKSVIMDGMQELERRINQIKRRMKRMACIITKRTFNKWLLQSSELLECLDDAEIDTSSKFELFDVLDTDLSGKLPFSETIEGLMKCRGPVSKTDIISIRLRVRYLTRLVQQIHQKMGCPPVK